jgi:SAM-dependent methyltransferase
MPKKPVKRTSKSTGKKTAKKAARPTLAQKADKHQLYQWSVQSPGVDIEFFTEEFTRHRGRKPMRLREDFCGTALMSTEWCKTDPERTALGVDLDGDTLQYGRERNLAPAGEAAKRVKLAQADVRETRFAKVDLTLAMNFSYCVFKTRDELQAYFAAAHKGLVKDGVLALEVYGGTESMSTLTEERDVRGGATYIWEQEKFSPISHETLCHISWRFKKDNSVLHRAFTYDWRLWTLPEMRELMLAAGFKSVKFYFERVDGDEDDEFLTGTGEFIEQDEIENQEAFLAYVLALK